MGQNSGHSSYSFTLKVLPIPPPTCFPDSTLVMAALGQKGSAGQWFNGLTRAAPCQSPLQTATYSPPQMQILGCSLTSHPLPVAFTSEESKLFSTGCLLSSPYFLSCNPAPSSYLGAPGHIIVLSLYVFAWLLPPSGRPIPFLSL